MSEQNLLDEIAVAEYLAGNLDFFSQHVELLARMYIPAQNGAGTISLVERQQQAQREKINQLEINHHNLLRIGNQNDAISEKLHQFTLRLFAVDSRQDCISSIENSIRNDFNVDHCLIIFSAKIDENAKDAKDHQLFSWVATLQEPYCGGNPDSFIIEQFDKDYVSFACIPLALESELGLMVLASKQNERFYSGMGTMFLRRIGELVSLALNKCSS